MMITNIGDVKNPESSPSMKQPCGFHYCYFSSCKITGLDPAKMKSKIEQNINDHFDETLS